MTDVEMKIGIQGGRGSYSEIVARQMLGEDQSLSYTPRFPDFFSALDAGEITAGLAAIANNRKGPISETNIAVHSGDYYVIGEGYLPVKHQLLALPGVTLAEIEEIHTQDHAREQCLNFLNSDALSPHVLRIDQDDTAKSALLVAQWGDRHKAAIASVEAAALYGLEVVASDIQDDPDNLTRFLLLQKRNGQQPSPTDTKSTLLFTTGQNPGALVESLTPLKERGINIPMLHSSYVPNSPFTMQFIMDVDAGLADPDMIAAIEEMRNAGCKVDAIGSYERVEVPHSGVIQNGK